MTLDRMKMFAFVVIQKLPLTQRHLLVNILTYIERVNFLNGVPLFRQRQLKIVV
jgi:hypothetical protein